MRFNSILINHNSTPQSAWFRCPLYGKLSYKGLGIYIPIPRPSSLTLTPKDGGFGGREISWPPQSPSPFPIFRRGFVGVAAFDIVVVKFDTFYIRAFVFGFGH